MPTYAVTINGLVREQPCASHAWLFLVGAIKEHGHKRWRLKSDSDLVTLRLTEDEMATLPVVERIRNEAPARDSKANNAEIKERAPLVQVQYVSCCRRRAESRHENQVYRRVPDQARDKDTKPHFDCGRQGDREGRRNVLALQQ